MKWGILARKWTEVKWLGETAKGLVNVMGKCGIVECKAPVSLSFLSCFLYPAELKRNEERKTEKKEAVKVKSF
jgi:hypothetical protein